MSYSGYAVHGKQIFLVADESTLSDMQYFNILVGSLETTDVNYLYDCEPNNNSIAQAVEGTVISFGISTTLTLIA